MWIFAAKLPNSDLNFAMDFGGDFFPKNPPQKFTQDFVRKNSPRTSAEVFSWPSVCYFFLYFALGPKNGSLPGRRGRKSQVSAVYWHQQRELQTSMTQGPRGVRCCNNVAAIPRIVKHLSSRSKESVRRGSFGPISLWTSSQILQLGPPNTRSQASWQAATK